MIRVLDNEKDIIYKEFVKYLDSSLKIQVKKKLILQIKNSSKSNPYNYGLIYNNSKTTECPRILYYKNVVSGNIVEYYKTVDIFSYFKSIENLVKYYSRNLISDDTIKMNRISQCNKDESLLTLNY